MVRLEENYRSTPQILAVANALDAGARRLREDADAHAPRRPEPHRAARAPTPRPRSRSSSARCGGCRARASPLEEIAVLYRINARSEPYEEAFAAAGLPYQVRDGAFLRRPGPRAVLARLRTGRRRRGRGRRGRHRRRWATIPQATPEADEEVTRQADLARLRALAAEFAAAHPEADVAGVRRGARPRGSPSSERAAASTSSPTTARRAWSSTPCSCRGCWRRAALQARPRGGGSGRGAPPALRRHHARAALPVPVVAARGEELAEPVPARARRVVTGAVRRTGEGSGRRCRSPPATGRCSTG